MKEPQPVDGAWPSVATRELAGWLDFYPEHEGWARGLASSGSTAVIAERLSRKVPARIEGTLIEPDVEKAGWLTVDWFYLARYYAGKAKGSSE